MQNDNLSDQRKKEAKLPEVIKISDYKKPDYQIPRTVLDFDIYDDYTQVQSILNIKRENPKSNILTLNGDKNLSLKKVFIDEKEIKPGEYKLTKDGGLMLPLDKDEAKVSIITRIDPKNNKSCKGMYNSGDTWITHNEAEGFRKITYFMDRPDVLSHYTVKVNADKEKASVLLSNGNKIKEGESIDGKRHWAVYDDPFPKPCYLFALVAGNLQPVKSNFKTRDGRDVSVEYYVKPGQEKLVDHSMERLKRAMKWDEDNYDRVYDLNNLKVVGVNDFNMGAMENKGLMIFNVTSLFVDPKATNDERIEQVQASASHEYFHNYRGNRVTVNKWHELTTKEGLASFAEHEFVGDMNSKSVERIKAVKALRLYQFPEDAGSNPQPIRPESYIAPDNLYSATTYNKGVEVIGMIKTIIGRDDFKKGMNIYFDKFDGKAVSSEDFLKVMQDVSGKDLSQFRRWYNQAGTPELNVKTDYNKDAKTYTVTIEQNYRPHEKTQKNQPYMIPFTMGLLTEKGQEIPLKLEGDKSEPLTNGTLILSQPVHKFVFENVAQRPIPSFLRNFSAPVKLNYHGYTAADLATLCKCDPDPFNKYEAGQIAARQIFRKLLKDYQDTKTFQPIDGELLDSFGGILKGAKSDPAFVAKALEVPSLNEMLNDMKIFNIDAAFTAHNYLKKAIGTRYESQLSLLYTSLEKPNEVFSMDGEARGKRALKNLCLDYLCLTNPTKYGEKAWEQFKNATNMTDEAGALGVLWNYNLNHGQEAAELFKNKWKDNSNAMNNYFRAQSSAVFYPKLVEHLEQLSKDKNFDPNNPDKIHALYGAFGENHVQFHQKDGSGYGFLGDKIISLGNQNPNTASNLTSYFDVLHKITEPRKSLMRAELQRIKSKNPPKEVLSKVNDMLKEPKNESKKELEMTM